MILAEVKNIVSNSVTFSFVLPSVGGKSLALFVNICVSCEVWLNYEELMILTTMPSFPHYLDL